MSILKQIHAKVDSYIDGQISLESFDEWLSPIAWNIEKYNEPDAEKLVYQIDILLAEYSQEHRTEASLKEELLALSSSG